MPPDCSTRVKISMASTLSFSMTRKSPNIMPALGAIQTCSAIRGPHSPRQRPSSQARSESFGLGINCGAVGVADASRPAAEIDFGCESAPADCRAEFAGEEAAKASAVTNANRRTTPVLMHNTLGLRAMPGEIFPQDPRWRYLVLRRFEPFL